VDAFVGEYAVAAEPVTERRDLVGRLDLEEMVRDGERDALQRARQVKQRRDIDVSADVEERVMVVLEELELPAAVPSFDI
jgi:hypothetical protein